MSDKELFTYRMRKSTRKIHAVSDALVNAKLAVALNSDSVWAEGLLVFYEIFKFLEEAMVQMKEENLGKMYIQELQRTCSFEKDLTYYYGVNWKKTYTIRDSVAKYLLHLKQLLEKDPDLLMAYVYHLYMGLLSGGQILKKKREIKNKVFPVDNSKSGQAVTDFGNVPISELKCKLKNIMNSIAAELDEEKKDKLINEGNKVFELNNTIIRTISISKMILLYRAVMFMLFILFIFVMLYLFKFS